MRAFLSLVSTVKAAGLFLELFEPPRVYTKNRGRRMNPRLFINRLRIAAGIFHRTSGWPAVKA
jgi:hypothetical protein